MIMKKFSFATSFVAFVLFSLLVGSAVGFPNESLSMPPPSVPRTVSRNANRTLSSSLCRKPGRNKRKKFCLRTSGCQWISSAPSTERCQPISPAPTQIPSQSPSTSPSQQPTSQPSLSAEPSSQPSLSAEPSMDPSEQPSVKPSNEPSVNPSMNPSSLPSLKPSLSQGPSVKPSNEPSVNPSMQPSVLPTLAPSTSAAPSFSPTVSPTKFPTVSPTKFPTANPTPQSYLLCRKPGRNKKRKFCLRTSGCQWISSAPEKQRCQPITPAPTQIPSHSPSTSSSPSQQPTSFSNAAIEIGEEIRFFVTNDIPYNTADAVKLRRELDVLSTDYGDFLIHLGDVQNARTSLCAYSQYDDVATLLWDHSDVPVFMIPGNNDWNECPMPWSAFEYWMEKLNRFEEWYATDKYDLPLVGRQNSRDENFAFLSKGVLFIGLNLVDGTVQDESEWDLRHLQNVQWVEQQLSENDEGEYRAIVMMGHAGFSSKVGDFFWPVIDRLKEVNKPVLYLHANDGSGMIEYSPVPDFPKFVAVRMEKGGIVGPTIVSVKGGDAPFSFTVMDA